MKKNLPVTDQEKIFDESCQIVSSTDLKGILRHVNDTFIDVSGFSPDELLDRSHNVVRHPDMPPAAFQNLWDTLKQGRPWMGIVKNRCKNGDYYWVDAFVTPVFDDGKVAGYESVRVKPAAGDVRRAETLYRKLWKGKGVRNWWPFQALHLKLATGFSAVLAALLAVLYVAADIPPALGAALLGVGSAAGLALSWRLTASVRKAAGYAKTLSDNPAMQTVYSGYADEGGQLMYAMKLLQGGLRTVLGRIQASSDNLHTEAEQTAAVVQETCEGIRQQQSETELLATAMEEMSATVKEIAQNTVTASDSAEQANDIAAAGKRTVTTSIDASRLLAQEVERAAQVIHRLEQDSETIGGVLDVIRAIAEQTNLLALNAAIEAARAGEQGRGFAVVADEVRTLASRTQASTEEIHGMITSLQAAAGESAEVMKSGQTRAHEAVEYANAVGRELDAITARISGIKDLSIQIASAVEEQSAVSEEISRNVHNINRVAEETAERSAATANSAQSVAGLASSLQALVCRFRTI